MLANAHTAATRRRRGVRAERQGRAAEAAARRHYVAMGATVLAERWRAPEGEIDLVARMGDTVIFVEVKSGRWAPHAISERQWRRLEGAASRYMLQFATGSVFARFDVALVASDGSLEIIENARVG
jgi:putative endonuclease